MGKNAAQRLAAVQAMVEQMAKVASTHPMRMVEVTRELFMDTVVLPLHDPTIARDIEAGAALHSDKAERVLRWAIARAIEDMPSAEQARAILAALREGLAEPEQPDDETIARVMGKVGRLDVDD